MYKGSLGPKKAKFWVIIYCSLSKGEVLFVINICVPSHMCQLGNFSSLAACLTNSEVLLCI